MQKLEISKLHSEDPLSTRFRTRLALERGGRESWAGFSAETPQLWWLHEAGAVLSTTRFCSAALRTPPQSPTSESPVKQNEKVSMNPIRVAFPATEPERSACPPRSLRRGTRAAPGCEVLCGSHPALVPVQLQRSRHSQHCRPENK